ncbi:MAG: hypothetical protein F4128_10760, partial [Gammaproteobacteria bacterium]|nr:hypothetical protein [Gammaproteobacteria bacterium]
MPHLILAGAFRHRQGGSLMLDAMAVLFVTSMLVGVFARQAEKEFRDDQIDHSRTGILIIAEALYAYRINELDSSGRPLRQWPGGWADLAGYAPGFAGSTPQGGRNGVGQPYSLTAPSPLTS